MKRLFLETDEWLRRRIRMGIWKVWKNPNTRIINLVKRRSPKWKVYQWGYTSQGYWRIVDSWIAYRSMSNYKLRVAGYPTLYEEYLEWHPK